MFAGSVSISIHGVVATQLARLLLRKTRKMMPVVCRIGHRGTELLESLVRLVMQARATTKPQTTLARATRPDVNQHRPLASRTEGVFALALHATYLRYDNQAVTSSCKTNFEQQKWLHRLGLPMFSSCTAFAAFQILSPIGFTAGRETFQMVICVRCRRQARLKSIS